MTHDTYRPPAYEEVSGGLDAAGKLVAWKLHITSPSITARMFPPVKGVDDSVVEAAVNNLYDVPNLAVSYSRQEIGIDVGYMRSVSHSPNCFVIESFMDELAALAGKDPYEFRLQHLARKPRQRQVLQLAAQRAGWGKAPAGRYQGIALMEGYTTHLAQVAEISLIGGDVKVHRITCVVDCGQMVNPKIVESQMESGIVFGLSAALWGDVTIAGGQVRQTNFNNYRVLAQQRAARARCPSHRQRRNPRRHRRGRRSPGRPRRMQCHICRLRKAAAGIADCGAEALESLVRCADVSAETSRRIDRRGRAAMDQRFPVGSPDNLSSFSLDRTWHSTLRALVGVSLRDSIWEIPADASSATLCARCGAPLQG